MTSESTENSRRDKKKGRKSEMDKSKQRTTSFLVEKIFYDLFWFIFFLRILFEFNFYEYILGKRERASSFYFSTCKMHSRYLRSKHKILVTIECFIE